jgi:hypothetical protein
VSVSASGGRKRFFLFFFFHHPKKSSFFFSVEPRWVVWTSGMRLDFQIPTSSLKQKGNRFSLGNEEDRRETHKEKERKKNLLSRRRDFDSDATHLRCTAIHSPATAASKSGSTNNNILESVLKD